MKIAVLSDIHGNIEALGEVLREAKKIKIEHIFVLGDLVGYYYHPDEVLKLLNDWPTDMIQGNHEKMLVESIENKNRETEISNKYGSGIKIAKKKLSSEIIHHLTNLPTRKRVVLDNIEFELCHGSPWDNDFYIYPDSDKEIFDRCRIKAADFVFLGHSHHPFVFNKNDCLIANVGSVGQSRQTGGVANWCIVDTSNKSLVFKNTPFETKGVVAEIERIDPDIPYLRDVLLRKL